MILKTIYIKIGDLGLPSTYAYGFLKNTRSMCNYIDREFLSHARFDADGFSRICVIFCTELERDFFVNAAKVACVYLKFDRQEYDKLSSEELNRFYADGIRAGVSKMEKFVALPTTEILKGVEAFETKGFVNKWIHKERFFKEFSLRATLKCELTRSDFILTLVITKDELVIFNESILRTDPDENAFAYRFKDIKVENGKLFVTSKTNENLFEKTIKEIESCAGR